jgi:hypothetical protein
MSKVYIRDFVDTDGKAVYEIEGLFEVEGIGIFRCNVRIDAATYKKRNVGAVRITPIPLARLQKSSSKLEQVAANLIRSQVSRRHKK